jgi:hypothetical protein
VFYLGRQMWREQALAFTAAPSCWLGLTFKHRWSWLAIYAAPTADTRRTLG